MDPGSPDGLRGRVRDFLYREVKCLNDHRYDDWLALLDDDFEYRMPIRTRSTASSADPGYYVRYDLSSVRARIDQMNTDYDWSEIPPSISRRLLSNVLVESVDEASVDVSSSFILRWTKADSDGMDTLSGERRDTLTDHDGSFRLAERVVRLDSPVVGLEHTQSLSVIV